MMQNENYMVSGLVAAPYTAFKPSGVLNTAVVPEYARYLKKNGVSGVFVNGTTGEGFSMNARERKINAEAWLSEQEDDFKVLVHVGSDNLPDALSMATHAAEHGAFAVAAMPPIYYKQTSITTLLLYLQRIAEHVADTPFFFYHFPEMSGVRISVKDILINGSSSIPNLVGVKFTHNDMIELKGCIELEKCKFQMLHGRDELLIEALECGIKAAVGSSYNFIPDYFITLLNAIQNNLPEKAASLQQRANRVIDVINLHGGTRIGKSVMRMRGIDLGVNRLPLAEPDKSEIDALYKRLRAANF